MTNGKCLWSYHVTALLKLGVVPVSGNLFYWVLAASFLAGLPLPVSNSTGAG